MIHSMIDIDRLKLGDNREVEKLYHMYFADCEKYILSNNGSFSEAQDVFQDCLVVLLTYLQNPDFELKVKLHTFIFAIYRYHWLNILKAKKRYTLTKSEMPSESDEINMEEMIKEVNKILYLEKALKLLKEDCRLILTKYYYEGIHLKDIASSMGYDENFIRVKKSRCMGYLRNYFMDIDNK